jgi:hypothetical protein
VFTETQLGSIARRLGYHDPHGKRNPRADVVDPRGDRRDRNVELLIDDPRFRPVVPD